MSVVRIKISKLWRDILAPLVAVICVLTIMGVLAYRLNSNECEFCPVSLKDLTITQKTVEVGQYVTLLDGICNDSQITYAGQIYLGAETVGTSSFNTRTIDLLTREIDGKRVAVTDTAEGRLSRTIEPGCTRTEPIIALLPSVFTPGKWRLTAHIVVTGPEGQTQDLIRTSAPFEVIE